MNKLRIAVLLALLMGLLVVGSAFAQVIAVDYDDTASDQYIPQVADEPSSLIMNGDFNSWSGGSEWIAETGVDCANDSGNSPDYWCVWGQGKAGWEDAHLAKTDLALGPAEDKGDSWGMGIFIRHQGNGSGSYYAGAWQPLAVETAGYYFINISETIWWNVDRYTTYYNSVAWYAITDSDDPMEDMGAWKELDPYKVQCPNDWEYCNYAGRDETVWVDPGQYLHLIVAHKFPVFNASSVFLLDDVSLVAADDNAETNANLEDPNGFYDWYWDDVADYDDEHSDKCHWADEDCVNVTSDIHRWGVCLEWSGSSCVSVSDVITWDQEAPR